MRAGIKNAGIVTDRAIYPYYTEYRLNNFNLTPNQVDTLYPNFKYDQGVSGIEPAWFENFETLFSSWETHPASDTVLELVNDVEKVFDGNFSGGIFLNDGQLFFEMISTPALASLPRNGIPIYLELNYKTNHKFIVGLYANNINGNFSVYTINPTTEWNKVYLDITESIALNNDANEFKISIGLLKDQSDGNVELYLDNIKLLHYK